MSQLQVTGEAKIRDLQGPVVANSGVITALDGLPSQYVRGDGTLADIPSVTGGGSSVSYYLNGSVNQGTFAGSTYYQMSKDAITGVGTNFSSSTDGLLAQFITDANDPDVSSIPSGNWNIEFYMGVSASSGALASFYVEFYKWNGSAFTFLASNVATPEFLTNTTTVDAYFTSVAFPETPLATTDRLAIRVYANVASKTVTMYTEDNRLCQIVTTFSKGLLSMNSLTDQEQYLTVGTAGTDFNIVSSIDTHTFNIPVASATNTGKLSSTDWSTFNNKVPYTGATGPVNLGAYDLTVNGLTIGKGGGGFASNTAIGLNVLASNAGINNLGVGGLALFSNTIGVQNAALGVVSLYSNTSGSYNSAVGYQSIYSNTTGTSNNALGSGSLYSNTTGANNVAIGNAALFGNVSGDGNTSIGVSSLQNSTGVRNTAIGYDAGNLIMTGSYNTIIGSYTGTSSMSSNVILADGQGNIRYRFDGTNNNFYNNIDLGINELTAGFVTSTGGMYATYGLRAGYGIILDKNGIVAGAGAGQMQIYAPTGTASVLTIKDGNSNFNAQLTFDNTASRTYTFPASSGTIALTDDLSAYVTLSTAQTISGNKTFSGTSLFTGTGTFNSSLQASVGIIFPTSGVVSNGAGIVGLGAYSGGLRTAFNGGYTSDLAFQMGANYVYTFPAASGTLALTSNIPSVSGTSGQVTYFNGTSSVTGSNNHFWDATNNRLGIGLTNPQRSLEIYSATADSHLRLSGNAPSVSMGESITGSVYQAKFGLATAAGQYVSGAVAGDFVMLSQTGATIFATGVVSGSVTEKMRLTSAGFFGIGTTSPSYLLDVNNSVDTYTQFRTSAADADVLLGFSNTGDGNNGWGIGRRNTGEFWIANYTGNFLGGTRTVPFQLASTGAATFSSTIQAVNQVKIFDSGYPTTYATSLRTASGAVGVLQLGNNNDNYILAGNTAANGYLIFKVNCTSESISSGIEAMRITSGGNVFIGTASSISSGRMELLIGGNAYGSIISLGNNGNANRAQIISDSSENLLIVNKANTPTIFYTNDTERMRILSNGNVGIGTSSPVLTGANRTTVDISGVSQSLLVLSTGSTWKSYFYNDGTNLSIACASGNTIFDNGGERMRITSGGDVLVGTTGLAVGAKLQLKGNASASAMSIDIGTDGYPSISFQNSSGNQQGYIVTNASSVQYLSISDYRLKQDFKDYNGLNLVNSIKTYDYEWKSDNSRMYGVIAHELQKVLPYAVYGQKDSEQMQGVDYSKIVPVLVKAIQEQQAKIEELSNKIVALESK
jgi:hypothetical protein